MSKRKRREDRYLTPLVIEARAGLIPASDDIENERRARVKRTARLVQTVRGYAMLAGCGSENLAITDIISDLRHYCEEKGLSFHKLNKAAYTQYLEEVAGPQLQDC